MAHISSSVALRASTEKSGNHEVHPDPDFGHARSIAEDRCAVWTSTTTTGRRLRAALDADRATPVVVLAPAWR